MADSEHEHKNERKREHEHPSDDTPAGGQNATPSADEAPNGGGGGWASQDDYEQRTAKTEDVTVPDGGERFRVRHVPPMRFAATVEEYGIDDLGADLQQVPEDVTMDDENLDETLKLIGLFRDVVVPNVIRPRNAHWANPPADPDAPEVFDISTITGDDLMTLVAAITDQDADELIQEGRTNARAQNRGQPENQRFRR